MVDISGMGSWVTGFALSAGFWLVGIIVVMVSVGLVWGYFGRKGKLKYEVLEVVRFGNGKIGINLMKAGLFKPKRFLYFWDYGNDERVMTSDGRTILGAETGDLHTIFGKKGFIVRRKDDDPKILVPLNKAEFQNEKLMFEIAPREFRDAATDLINEATKETTETWTKIVQFALLGLCIVMTIISVVINQQMTNNTVNKVGNMLIKGCENYQSSNPGGSP